MTSAERMRRFRKRRAEGAVVLKLVLDAGGIADLVDLGWVRPGANRKAVAEGFVDFVGMAIDVRVKPERNLDLRPAAAATPGEVWERRHG